MRIVRPVVATVGGLSHTVRDIARMREVATGLVRHGMGMLVSHIHIPGFRSVRAREFKSEPESELDKWEINLDWVFCYFVNRIVQHPFKT